ncbi:hypothetical protein R1sor_025357 [Riccia sorocarpa]|uniref:Uncharacterized protein n=1 Tax=Riccia sorocarpa TaxID=122646 RepID=A0ABD3GE28_9MARC
MARFNIQVVLLVAMAAVMISATGVSARCHRLARPSLRDSTGVLCVGEVAELISQNEGRQHTAYDHRAGFRAVGCGYNLDDNPEERRKELEAAGLDYDRVYKGETRLNSMEITGLLIHDAKRALDRVRDNIQRLDNFCCSMRAIFADIQHTVGSKENFPRDDVEQVIDRVDKEDYKKAADELEKSDWCSKSHHRNRCDRNLDVLERGCGRSTD